MITVDEVDLIERLLQEDELDGFNYEEEQNNNRNIRYELQEQIDRQGTLQIAI